MDHFDDLVLAHLYFAAGFDGVAVGELAAVGYGAVEVVGAEGAVSKAEIKGVEVSIESCEFARSWLGASEG